MQGTPSDLGEVLRWRLEEETRDARVLAGLAARLDPYELHPEKL